MSYVLDALKKSDQERQRRTTPGIHSVHAPVDSRHSRRILRPYLLALSVLFNACLLLWWLSPWQAEKQGMALRGSPNREITVSKDQPGGGVTAEQVQPATPRVERTDLEPPKSTAPETKPSLSSDTTRVQTAAGSDRAGSPASRESAGSEAVKSLQDSRSEEAKYNQDKPPSKPDLRGTFDFGTGRTKQSLSPRPSSTQTSKRDRPGPGKMDTGSVSAPGSIAMPSPSEMPPDRLRDANANIGADEARKPQSKPGASRLKGAVEKKETTPQNAQPAAGEAAKFGAGHSSIEDSDFEAEKSVPQLSELPLSMRHSVPNLSFSMLVYSRNPADRIARVNGQVVREGQEMSADLKLESITPDGAIFNYRGYRFHKSVR